MTYIQEGKRQLREGLETAGRELIQRTEETRQRRLTGLLLRRQGEALDWLDCVEAKAEASFDAPAKKSFGEKVLAVFAHPAATLLLALAALVLCGMTGSTLLTVTEREAGSAGLNGTPWWILSLAAIVLLILQAVVRLVTERKKQETAPKVYAESVLDLDRGKAISNRLLQQISIDSEEIAAVYAREPGEELRPLEEDAAKLFADLYETQQDHPEVMELEDALSRVKLLLRKLGLHPAEYGPETRRYFHVETADFPSQMRYPAVLRTKNAEVILTGEYIRNQAER